MSHRCWLGALTVVSLAALLVSSCAKTPSSGTWKPRLVVLVAVDTLRADHLGAYGYARPTSPNIDRLAREGVVFENAFSQSNESLFSYTALFSGQYPRQFGPLSHDAYRLPATVTTFPSLLRSYGCETAAFVAGGHLSRSFGFAEGFGTYRDEWNFGSLFHTMPPAFDWLAAAAARQSPSFLFIHGYDLHTPYYKPMFFGKLFQPGYTGVADDIVQSEHGIEKVYRDRLFSHVRAPIDPQIVLPRLYRQGAASTLLTAPDRAGICAAYDGAVAYADAWIGLLAQRIEALGLARDTLVLIIGDHGEELFDHGFVGHINKLHGETLHVPLVAWAPGALPAGRRISDVVELRALGSTILNALVPAAPPPEGPPSLLPLLRGAPRPPRPGLAISEGIFPLMAVRSARHFLVYDGGGRGQAALRADLARAPLDGGAFQLYEVAADPGEHRNLLSKRRPVPPEAAALRAALAAVVTREPSRVTR